MTENIGQTGLDDENMKSNISGYSSSAIVALLLTLTILVGCDGSNNLVSSEPNNPSDTQNSSNSTNGESPGNSGESNTTNENTTSTEQAEQAEQAEQNTDNLSACNANNNSNTPTLIGNFDSITNNLGTESLSSLFAEETTGTLNIGLNASAFPVISTDKGVVVAASQLGQGRVVVFSGQDFLSSGTRSTLLGNNRFDTLLNNAVGWASAVVSGETITASTDNVTIANKLQQTGITTNTVSVLPPNGLREFRVWDEAAFASADVAVVQINEWGTLHLNPQDTAALRDFVTAGGGLVIAGSALHWSWWLSDSASEFPANTLLKNTGIEFNTNSIDAFTSTDIVFNENFQPVKLWCNYVNGNTVDDVDLNLMSGLFQSAHTQGLTTDLDKALRRMTQDTPALPVEITNSLAKLSADIAAELPAYDWPSTHPWIHTLKPGYENAITDRTEVTISGEYSGNQPLGLYALPGKIVTVTVDNSAVTNGLQLQVGEKLDDLRRGNTSTGGQWRRAPFVSRVFDITKSVTEITNAYGGAIYLDLPAVQGPVNLVVENALPMPVYTYGETTTTQWTEDVAGSFAPVAIIQQRGHVRMLAEITEAQAVVQPDEVMEFWSGFHQHHVELAQEPAPRKYESHWVFDDQIGFGYANATDDRIVYPQLAERWALRTQTGDEDWWLFGHELGHQFQTSNWTGGDITEVAVNLFTMYTLNDYIFSGTDNETLGFSQNNIDHGDLIGANWATADFFGKLQMYRQLVRVFGWNALKRTFASYYDSNYPIENYGEFMDGFAIRFSTIVQRDLSEFFLRWNYPASDNAIAFIRSFNYTNWLPPGWE